METLPKTTVFLVPAEVQQFLLFQQHYDVFSVLSTQRIFDIQYGKAILNFMGGELRSVTREEVVYRK